jgi:hypothetical protein
MSEKTQINSEVSGFNFQEEVARLFHDFPQLWKTTLFLTTDDHFYEDSPLKFHGNAELEKLIYEEPYLYTETRDCLIEAKRTQNSFAFKHPAADFNRIVVNPVDKQVRLFGKIYETFVQTLTLDHEIGHILVPHAAGASQVFNECAADAFATIRILQRGLENREALSLHSSWRAYEVLQTGDMAYLTTPVVDKIIEDSYSVDFKKLTPQQTVQLAGEYAQRYMPAPKDFFILKQAFLNQKKDITAILATPHKFAFYIGARALQLFSAPQGITMNGMQVKLSGRFKEAIMNRAQDFTLDGFLAVLTENKPVPIQDNKRIWTIKSDIEGASHVKKPQL